MKNFLYSFLTNFVIFIFSCYKTLSPYQVKILALEQKNFIKKNFLTSKFYMFHKYIWWQKKTKPKSLHFCRESFRERKLFPSLQTSRAL